MTPGGASAAADQRRSHTTSALAQLVVLVPTRNESGNVHALVSRLDAALGGLDAEIVFVDDSSDDTPEQIRAVAAVAHRPVRVLHRTEEQRVGGLGGAVLHGLQHTSSTWVVVMDGDLQHPPEIVPELVALGIAEDADLVVASRYFGSGTADGLSSAVRERVSGGATALTKMVFPRRLADCTDPMSGFFAVRRAAVASADLRPQGFKILLEMIARSRSLRIRELPFTFEERLSGDSKASLREGVLFVKRLLSLRCASSFGRLAQPLARVVSFGLVGLSGIVVNSLVLYLLVSGLHNPVLVSAVVATQASTLWNFLLTDRWVFKGPKHSSIVSRLTGFAVVNNLALLARLPLLAWLVHGLGISYLAANVLTLLAVFVARYVISDRFLFRSEAAKLMNDSFSIQHADKPTTERKEKRSPVDVVIDVRDTTSSSKFARRTLSISNTPASYLPYRYDIHGLLTVGSAVELRELEYFRSAQVAGPYDIEIRSDMEKNSFRRRTRVTQFASPPGVSYEEHLGRFGSDFRVEMSDRIQVHVGPMLVKSPHVLYTNVVEALLRFVLVSRGYMLLHSACLELDGRGVMLSALTDTGKTGTILRLLRENSSKFLSDDMTILGPDGTAMCYPKPLTISQHTLRAVNAGDLSRKEWRRLRLQSRLHSKEGRGIGTRLGEMNVPIMSLNALVQFLVPPPKYVVDRLVPCEHTSKVEVRDLFIIERSDSALADIDNDDALLDELIANTDDAYGFPPFRYFAPAIVIDGLGYEELRAKERSILASALAQVRARRVATPDYTWADRIPELVGEGSITIAGPRVPVADALSVGTLEGAVGD
ncbi:MAG: glycosyltransferase [Actinomycetes bacterium]